MRTGLVVASLAVVLAGCGGMTDRDSKAFWGAAAGAGAGALVATAATGGNVLIGAAVGGAVGGTISYFIRPEGCFYRNARGEFWQVPCDQRIVGRPACFIGNDIVGYEPVDCPRRHVSRRTAALELDK
jgi:osmotically inducible lipoprotein OsmB